MVGPHWILHSRVLIVSVRHGDVAVAVSYLRRGNWRCGGIETRDVMMVLLLVRLLLLLLLVVVMLLLLLMVNLRLLRARVLIVLECDWRLWRVVLLLLLLMVVLVVLVLLLIQVLLLLTIEVPRQMVVALADAVAVAVAVAGAAVVTSRRASSVRVW